MVGGSLRALRLIPLYEIDYIIFLLYSFNIFKETKYSIPTFLDYIYIFKVYF